MTKRDDDEFLHLNSKAVSTQARSLIERLGELVTAWEAQNSKRTNKRGKGTQPRFLEAIERFTGDLLLAKASKEGGGRLYRSLNRNDWTSDKSSVTLKVFKPVLDAFKALNLVGHTPGVGIFTSVPQWNLKAQNRGIASRFSAAPKMLAIARRQGVSLKSIDDHFHPEPPRFPLVLRAANIKSGGSKVQGWRMEFARERLALFHEDNVRKLNTFLGDFDIQGANHYYFIRLFNEGNVENPYGWDKGGRLYSKGPVNKDGYQRQSDTERAKIIINGEPTVEIDIGSSYLTIFHALLEEPLDLSKGDPYERVLRGKRSLVKLYASAMFGAGRFPQQWPSEMTKDYAKENKGKKPKDVISVAKLADLMKETFPALEQLGSEGTSWADLMFEESVVVTNAVFGLRDKGIPSLPVHDSLIVPFSHVTEATQRLYGEFERTIGVRPLLKTKSKLVGAQEQVEEAMRAWDSRGE
jgi:hypothetical protein